MRRTVPPSAEIQAEIDKLLASRVADDPQKLLSELARLGARLIIQRAGDKKLCAAGLSAMALGGLIVAVSHNYASVFTGRLIRTSR